MEMEFSRDQRLVLALAMLTNAIRVLDRPDDPDRRLMARLWVERATSLLRTSRDGSVNAAADEIAQHLAAFQRQFGEQPRDCGRFSALHVRQHEVAETRS